MRIGAMFEPTAAAFYRGVYPLEAMERRGHEIVWPHNDTGDPRLEELASCDAIFVFRRSEATLLKTLRTLVANGSALVWDTDDDLAAIPKNSPLYKSIGGLHGQRRFADTVRIARMAHVVTTTSRTLAARYESNGIAEVEVIENHLQRRSWRRPQRHRGLVVGWIAGMEHTADVVGLGLTETLEAIQRDHPDVQVESVGVDLHLRERYTRHSQAHFNDLPRHMARYDIGLAPLIDIPFNAARSNIKVKEYAASGVPWLASPRAPYVDLGERQGGLLVADDEWPTAIDRLLNDKRLRKKLSRNGRAWALTQTIDAVADRWEQVFLHAVDRAQTPAAVG